MKHLLATSLAALSLALPACAQSTNTKPFTDPANLRGERVAPLTGRELPIDKGALGLQELLRKLNTRASILNIVAHPDDEDGGMLTLYSRGYGARVADLSLTRGEGGQNAMTADFEDALGLLRTQELLSNDRYTGVTQMFGTEVDFGFSKTKAEAFAKWNHDRVLYDAVRAIRLYRPLVITATFIGNPTDGHGQHQVSGEIAQEAFVAAGDPNVFPELTREGILPWQPLRMYARAPFSRVTGKGLYDYATNQYVPVRFTNYVTGVTSTTPPTPDITIHEGTDDPLLTTCAANSADLPAQLKSADCKPLSYVQFARIGLGLQRTQIGPGVRNAGPGRFDVPYHLYGSRLRADRTTHPSVILTNAKDPCISSDAAILPVGHNVANPNLASQPSFFDGIDITIEGIGALTGTPFPPLQNQLHNLSARIELATEHFDPTKPSAIAPQLADALKTVDTTISLVEKSKLGPVYAKENVLHDLRIKRVQLNEALVLALGLRIDSDSILQFADVPIDYHPEIRQTADAKVHYLGGWSENSKGQKQLSDRDQAESVTLTPRLEEYRVADPKADIEPGHVFAFPCRLSAEQNPVTRPYFYRTDIEQPVYKLSNPALRNAPSDPPAITCWANLEYDGVHFLFGGVQIFEAQPALNIRIFNHAIAVPHQSRSFHFTAVTDPENTPIRSFSFDFPKSWTVSRQSFGKYNITFPNALSSPITLHASAIATDGHRYTESFETIGYLGLPTTLGFQPAEIRIVPMDLNVPPHLRIAYIPGTGDDVAQCLKALGIQVDVLTFDAWPKRTFTAKDLAKYDTVILGVRTYDAHPELHGALTQALLDYARNGGNVLVQYQTREFTSADAPFPLSLGSDEKVVGETDPVDLLHTDSTLLTTPNHIATSDFDHWIEERGHGFLGSWDPRYTALTETHDPGQAPQRGGLITVRLGRGRWTYCAFALYRQLPEAVPGAFRLFVNLLNP